MIKHEIHLLLDHHIYDELIREMHKTRYKSRSAYVNDILAAWFDLPATERKMGRPTKEEQERAAFLAEHEELVKTGKV